MFLDLMIIEERFNVIVMFDEESEALKMCKNNLPAMNKVLPK